MADDDGTTLTEEVVEEERPEINIDQFVKKEDYQDLNTKLEMLSQKFDTVLEMQRQPSTPAAPSGPSVDDQVRGIDEQLHALSKQLDEAQAEGRSIAEIIGKREELIQRKSDIRYQRQIDELRAFGETAIDQLSGEVTKGQMQYLEVPEIKAAYDKHINSMTPGQRMSPEVRVAAYRLAIGENMEKVVALEVQKQLRKDEEPPEAPPAKGREPGKKGELSESGIPRPEDVLDKENLKAIEHSKHKDVDSYYQSLGYENWEDFWEKTGKDYFEGIPEEEE